MTVWTLNIETDPAGLQANSDAGLSIAPLQSKQNAAYQIVAVLASATGTLYIIWTDAEVVYASWMA